MRRTLIALVLCCSFSCSSSSSCRAPTLVPKHLPRGFRSVSMQKLVDSVTSETYSDGSRVVQVLNDVQGSLGDGKDAKMTKVRGYIAVVGSTGLDQAPLAVEWRDVCSVSYAVMSKGLSEDETLKIANGLRPAR